VATVVSILVLVGGFGGRRLSPVALFALALLMAIVLVPLQGVIAERLVSSDHGAAAGRVPLIRMALEMIGDHPLLGVGANNFVIRVHEYAGGEFASAWISSVHNKYLLIWSEAGFAALLAYLVLLGTGILRGWRARLAPDPLLAGVGLGLAAAIAGHAVHSNFEIFAGGTTTEMLWLGLALLATPVFAPWVGHTRTPPSQDDGTPAAVAVAHSVAVGTRRRDA